MRLPEGTLSRLAKRSSRLLKMNHTERYGYRGYVASRPVRGNSFPQQVQNLVVRDYASRKELKYLLSATEYAMSSGFLMLNFEHGNGER